MFIVGETYEKNRGILFEGRALRKADENTGCTAGAQTVTSRSLSDNDRAVCPGVLERYLLMHRAPPRRRPLYGRGGAVEDGPHTRTRRPRS